MDDDLFVQDRQFLSGFADLQADHYELLLEWFNRTALGAPAKTQNALIRVDAALGAIRASNILLREAAAALETEV